MGFAASDKKTKQRERCALCIATAFECRGRGCTAGDSLSLSGYSPGPGYRHPSAPLPDLSAATWIVIPGPLHTMVAKQPIHMVIFMHVLNSKTLADAKHGKIRQKGSR
jgi:hypothetical protein